MMRSSVVLTVVAVLILPLRGGALVSPPGSSGPIDLRLATPSPLFPLVVSGKFVVFPVSESANGHVDLNGDGDATDTVLHLFNSATGVTTNLGLASAGFNVAADNQIVAFTVSESQQGNTDLNGDGDTADDVLYVLDVANGNVTNLGLAVVGAPAVHNHLVVFGVSESQQAATDLNGDGDIGDRVVHVFDATTGEIIDLGLASNGKLSAGEVFVTFSVNETLQGHTDMNGDGDVTDDVLHVYNAVTHTTTNVGLALWNNSTWAADGRLVAFVVSESHQGGTDLNGDGDTGDEVVHIYDAVQGTTTNLRVAQAAEISGAPSRPSVSGTLVVFPISESAQGNVDLNGDGDKADSVLHVFDAASGTMTNLRLALFPGPPAIGVDGTLVAFNVWETGQGNTDLNGNGHSGDMVEHVYDAASGTITNLRLASLGPPVVSGKLVAFGANEFFQGTDLNGDGDMFDSVVHLYDGATGTTSNLRLAAADSFSAAMLALDGRLLAFPVSEFLQGNTDLNGDGDAFDFVLHTLSVRGPTH